MRCKNCGWENAEGIPQCEKCSSQLTLEPNAATMYDSRQETVRVRVDEPTEFGGTVVDAIPSTPPPFRGNMMSTVSEPMRFDGAMTEMQPQLAQDMPEAVVPAEAAATTNCQQCGYPLSDDVNECPYCHTVIEQESCVVMEKPEAEPNIVASVQPEAKTCGACGASVPADARFCLSCGSSMVQPDPAMEQLVPHINRVTMGTVRNATVLPGFGEAPKAAVSTHYCTLRRREWPGETVRYTPTTYPGDSVVLNRMNTDQNNNTITSKEQAVITCEDGQWYIEDRSALQSTYVRVSGKNPIKPGDIILLGNREFEFQGF